MNSIRNLGEFGWDGIASTDESEPGGNASSWFALHFVEDTVFTTLTGKYDMQSGAVTDFLFTAGQIIFGNFTVIKLSSGGVIAYRTQR